MKISNKIDFVNKVNSVEKKNAGKKTICLLFHIDCATDGKRKVS